MYPVPTCSLSVVRSLLDSCVFSRFAKIVKAFSQRIKEPLKAAYPLRLSICDIKLYLPLGYYPEERVVGQSFRVDLSMQVSPTDPEDLQQTADYAAVVEYLRQLLNEPRELMESKAVLTHEKLSERFPVVEKLAIKLTKLDPPVKGVGESSITFDPDAYGFE